MSKGEALHLSHVKVGGLTIADFTIAAGEIVCLSGASGSGKTRLLRAIADLDPHEGQLRLGQLCADQIPAHQWRARVMLIPAESHWWGDQVGDHFPDSALLPPAALGFPDDVMAWQVMRLSSGEKQRLALWRGMVRNPDVLLLDEPTANLDETTTLQVEAWLQGWIAERQLATLWVTHGSDQIGRVAQRHVEIVDGKLQVSE